MIDIQNIFEVLGFVVPVLTLLVLTLTYLKKDPNTEIKVYNTISNAKGALTLINESCDILNVKKETGTLTVEEENTFVVCKHRCNIAIQNYLNAYDMACLQYLRGAVNRSRFKDTYHIVIRQIMEAEIYKEYLDRDSSPYDNIKKVYRKWEKK